MSAPGRPADLGDARGADRPPPVYSARCAGPSSSLPCSRCWSVRSGATPGAAADRTVRILTGAPTTLDPAAQGDAGSAAVTAQLFESLTAFDANREVRPALAESWRFDDGAKRVTFHLRNGLTFSDGSPLRPSDVQRSWLRLIDPAHPSPLASIAFDIVGAEAYLRGQSKDPSSVGIHADDAANDLTVDLVRPAADFVNIVAGPSFSVVPPAVGKDAGRAAAGQPVRRERRIRPDRDDLEWARFDGQRALLGRYDQPCRRSSSSATWAAGARSRRSRTASSTTRRSAASTRRGSCTTRRSDRRSSRSRRSRPSTTASRRPGRRSTTSRSARRSPRRSIGVGWWSSPIRAATSSSPIRWSRPASLVEARPISSRSTIRQTRASFSRRRASRAAPGSPRR